MTKFDALALIAVVVLGLATVVWGSAGYMATASGWPVLAAVVLWVTGGLTGLITVALGVCFVRLRRSRKAVGRVVEPTPPEGVRWIRGDGSEIPLECRYVGIRNGFHHWQAVITPQADITDGSLHVAVWPGSTGIKVVDETELT